MIKKSFRIFAVPLFSDNYSYIIQTCTKEPLLLVDPANPDVIIDCLNKYFVHQHVGHILYTHKHWDHAGGSEDLFKRLHQKYQKLQVYAGVQDSEHIKTVTHRIQKDEELMIGKNKVRAYKVPCHTRGHTIYHLLFGQNEIDAQMNKNEMKTSEGKKIRVFEEPECAFSGDTLFCGGIGRFFEGNATQMYANISKINQKINKNVSIYNGHEYTLQNLKWGTEVQPQNEKIKEFITQIEFQDQTQICTLPTTPSRQSDINPFYRAVVKNQNSLGVSGIGEEQKLYKFIRVQIKFRSVMKNPLILTTLQIRKLYQDIQFLYHITYYLLKKKTSKQMFNYMGCNEEMVQQGVKQFGLATGARKMIDNQYVHAEQSLKSGIYITYWNQAKKSECSRLGSNSKCFCGHKMGNHNDLYFGKKFNTACKDCTCKKFMFVPTRPEQCGMYWLVRRKDFNVNTWRPPCKCKHTTEEHSCNYPLRCKKCPCGDFNSNFACLTCDGLWEHHQVLYQTADQRKMLKKKIGQQYIPLSSHKNIQQEVFKDQKFSRIPNRSLPAKQKKEMDEKHKMLNPKQPTKEELAKIKSPLGFIIKPRYPEFLKKN